MERFYLKTNFIASQTIELKETEHHHLSRVLRLREKEEVEICNGLGSLAKAKIIEIEKERTLLEILSVENTTPLPNAIFLAIPMMRPSKLEWVIEKGTEIGANGFFIYTADRSTQESLSSHQIERLRIITISALKQSKRLFLPSLEIASHLTDLFKKEATILFGSLEHSASNLTFQNDPKILMITGPESGFSKEELQLLKSKANGVRLNPNILRAETAPIVALSLLCVGMP